MIAHNPSKVNKDGHQLVPTFDICSGELFVLATILLRFLHPGATQHGKDRSPFDWGSTCPWGYDKCPIQQGCGAS